MAARRFCESDSSWSCILGQEIETDEFAPEQFAKFAEHLKAEMELLRTWFAGKKFAEDDFQCGLELEAWLIDDQGLPAPDNALFLQTLERKWVVPELSKFNFEVNVSPQYLSDDGLSDMQSELRSTWMRCEKVAERLDHRIVAIGILPTVTNDMLCIENMSPLKRYAALNKQVLRLRGGSPLTLNIDGKDSIYCQHTDLMLESAATSVQVHLKVPFSKSARFYNASVLASPFTVAMAANAPLLFGKQLWADTRIPVFEQAVDTAGPKPRVTFGEGFIDESLLEYFERNMENRHLLPAIIDEAPALMPYVRMHNGTIWNWNRTLIGFEADGTPHIRIEHRPMSASPSMKDLFADIHLYLGLVFYFANLDDGGVGTQAFEDTKWNFYQSARFGLEAELKWEGKLQTSAEILRNGLLQRSMEALENQGVAGEGLESSYRVLSGRLESMQNGAAWQLQQLKLENGDLVRMLEAYESQQAKGEPVHNWTHS